ncbi:probable LRR receptor-like serine/threonine-protein kinase IRK [Cucurbita maxima]|uniref:Probable LRR receptor-like serine/threonine-protein kinase IRK n=1 Tax=Cucurbita maxima TaxID=3661 RepID=A0A6J1JIA9_CUCMA|nr:probable LRR receptor-like serine/threonine-protein kinase IRK [Cucurbita maxima]
MKIFSLLLLLLSLSSLAHSLTSPSDLSALKSFKSAIKPSSIPPWSCLASWNFSVDPCALPRRTSFSCGLLCNPAATRITQLTLDPAGYSGTLSPLLSRLTQLTVLDLADNSFSGLIPSAISSLSNLQILILRSNSFTGAIPPSISNLKSLESLDLSHNSLAGNLPKSLVFLSALRRLDLSFNRLTGSIPKLPPNLLELALKRNSLSGYLEKSSFLESTQLEVIELSENSLAGTSPAWFFLLPSVQQINLANNSLTRVEISPAAATGSDLVAVDLGFNRIEGNVPVNFASYPALSALSLRYNRLRGTIPLEFSQMKTMKRLYLDGNFLTGKPPAEFFFGGDPVSGSLGDNCLQGCPQSSHLCAPSQKPNAVCKEAYGSGRGKGKPMT